MKQSAALALGALAIALVASFGFAWVSANGEKEEAVSRLQESEASLREALDSLEKAESRLDSEKERAARAEDALREELRVFLREKAELETEARENLGAFRLEQAKSERASRRLRTMTKPFLSAMDAADGESAGLDAIFLDSSVMDAGDMMEWMADMRESTENNAAVDGLAEDDLGLMMIHWLDDVAGDLVGEASSPGW